MKPEGKEEPMRRAPSYIHGATNVPLLGETIGDNLRRTVDRFGEREALVVSHQSYRATYRQLWDQTGLAARGLLACGVRRGDRIGIWAPNRFEWVVVQYAAARIGAILVNINPADNASELEFVLNHSGTSLLLLARAFRGSNYALMLAQVREQCAQLRESIVLDDDWQQLLSEGERTSPDDLAALEALLQFDDPISVQYTSGTTGFPKGATLSHHSILNNGFFVGEALRYSEHDRVCIPSALLSRVRHGAG
jgi:fatty-acyl-CoA synthase